MEGSQACSAALGVARSTLGTHLLTCSSSAGAGIRISIQIANALQVAFWIRKATGTELMDFPYHSQPIAFSMWIPAAWGE